ncbi:L-gulonolactone oxidase [Pseudolycoriella hygida]|uniref:L-gulonolactone oxidase n=1 Tax=Pseudolycoriella hygida TaxID=35572 RepID=A0A9Q0S6P6_9DIPT|nr:L-gulonolactone oxidase [Pseudolycoriella hygida]
MEFNLKLRILLISIAFGLLSAQPILAAIQRPTDYSSYVRYPLCRTSHAVRFPTNLEDVVSIINEAIYRGVSVKAFGMRHSTTDIICTDGIPIDMRLLKSMKMNDDKTVTFGAGVTLQEAGEFLLQHGLALRVVPAFGNLTLAGVIGTGAHGSSIKFHSTISAQVTKMTIVDGRGTVKVISTSNDLKAFKIHLGLLGVIVDLTLETVPLYKVKSHVYVASDAVLQNGEAINWAKASDQLTLFWFPSINEVVVSNLSFVAPETVGNHKLFMSTTFRSNVLDTIYKESAYNLSSNDCTAASTLGNKMMHLLEMRFRTSLVQLGESEASSIVGYPHDVLSAICGVEACMWSHPKPFAEETLEMDFDFNLNDLPAAASTIKDIISKTPTSFPMHGIVIRFSGKSDIYMSTSYKRDSCHLGFKLWLRTDAYNHASGNLAGYQTISQVLTKKFKARSHWGKGGLVYHNRRMLDLKLDPYARQKFISAMEEYDPNGIFLNNFGRRLIYDNTEIDSDPLTTRCALLDNCFCSKNADCGLHQTCTTISGFDYPVCQTKNVVTTKFELADFPASFQVENWFFNTFPPAFQSLKCQQ